MIFVSGVDDIGETPANSFCFVAETAIGMAAIGVKFSAGLVSEFCWVCGVVRAIP